MKKVKEILISVIVPCYNVEKYIVKCLDSLVNQKQKNIEIIIVEDCSTDKTRLVIEDYLSNHASHNIVYIKNDINKGLAESRNIGISKASGKYIGFVDSDDYVGDDYYFELYAAIVSHNADLAIADMNIVYENRNNAVQLSKVTDGGVDALDFVNNGLAASACNKLISIDLMKRFPFLSGKINEDIAAIIPIIVNASKIVYVSNVQYNYVQRDSSIQNSSISFRRFDVFDAVEVCLKKIRNIKLYSKYKEAIIYQQIIMFFIYVIPKEKQFFKRYKLLKQFNKLSKKYDIRKNSLLWNFLARQGRYHKYYYKLLLKLNCSRFYFLTNLLISLYNFYRLKVVKSVIKDNITIDDLIKMAKRQRQLKSKNLTISVVIPNYNYERFMLQRLYSILCQKVKINEIIILDDCSTDNSRKLIDKLYKNLSPIINIKKIYNDVNSGSAFKQWQKGFELAKSDYVWIAEADDYCNVKFLKEVTKPIRKDNNIMISYSDTAFIDVDGKIFMRTIKPEIDIMKTHHWDSSYVNDGVNEIKNYSYLNCTIANVSSAIIKNSNYNNFFKDSGEYKQAGDWLFYVNVISNGKIAYCNETLNYYRVHGNNVSSVTKKQAHFDEIKRIHKYFIKKFKLTAKHKKMINKRYEFLKRVWDID
jgi:glycosyltransferase involved in cell wall biosynthesis